MLKHSTCLAALLIVLCGNHAATADESAEPKTDKTAEAKEAEAIFEQIKSLAGDWVMAEGPTADQTALSVRVIAGGSAVVERQFPGSPMEMITVYHLNGEEVMLTHYCMLGNQPRLKATRGEEKNTLLFKFVSATNMASDKDPHMHEGKMTIVDKDTVKSTWTQYVDGKPEEAHTFELTRKK